MSEESARISPTAHYTGYVWYRHGLSHPALRTRTGAMYHASLALVNATYARVHRGLNLDKILLARHAAIDAQLDAAITSGRVGQVLEIACGMSPRGLRFSERYRHLGLRYVEADLEGMSRRKRDALDGAGLRGPDHHVVQIDAFADSGPHSLDAVFAEHLDPEVGTAVVTEGLINYFDRGAVEGLWARIARALKRGPAGLYLSDIHLEHETFRFVAARIFRRALRVFARGDIHFHFAGRDQAVAALDQAGFDRVRVDNPAEYGAPAALSGARRDIVRVISAETGGASAGSRGG